MKNTTINKQIIQRIANALGELNNEVIFVGGATVSLYINDEAAEDVRPTKDIDISVSVATINELEDIREKLTSKGFVQSAELDVICRFKFDDILVDVMNTNPISWAPANHWFKKDLKIWKKFRLIKIQFELCFSIIFWPANFLHTKIVVATIPDLVMI